MESVICGNMHVLGKRSVSVFCQPVCCSKGVFELWTLAECPPKANLYQKATSYVVVVVV